MSSTAPQSGTSAHGSLPQGPQLIGPGFTQAIQAAPAAPVSAGSMLVVPAPTAVPGAQMSVGPAPTRTPAMAAVGGIRGIALELKTFQNPVTMMQAIRELPNVRASDRVDIISWSDLSLIGTSCVMSLTSSEWVLEPIHRVQLEPKTIIIHHRPTTWNAEERKHDVERTHMLLDSVQNFWIQQVDVWIQEMQNKHSAKDEIRSRMIACLRVNRAPTDRFIELLMFSPM